jgi:hypothetical protein
MIRRHHLVEIKRVKELALSTLSPSHHRSLRESPSQSDGITVPSESFATHSPIADITELGQRVRFVPMSEVVELHSKLCDLVSGQVQPASIPARTCLIAAAGEARC